jgi:hypothetical protein
MFASVLIFILSFALLIYWFRYSCVLLLRNQTEHAASLRLAIPGTFTCAEVQDRLRDASELEPLYRMLERDHEVLTYLVRHASGIKLESFEEKLLLWDYKVMQFWYGVARTIAPQQARQALSEMASVLTILSGRLGRRAGLATEA